LLRLAWNLEIEPVAVALRMIAVLGWTLVLATLPAAASSPEPSREVMSLLVKSCSTDGPFFYRFGEHDAYKREPVLQPFAIETFLSDRHDGLFGVVAAASFAHAPMSQEDRVFLANWVFRTLDADIAAGHRFQRRETRRDGVSYFAANIVFDLSRDGTTVRLACTDTVRKQQAHDEMREPGTFSGR